MSYKRENFVDMRKLKGYEGPKGRFLVSTCFMEPIRFYKNKQEIVGAVLVPTCRDGGVSMGCIFANDGFYEAYNKVSHATAVEIFEDALHFAYIEHIAQKCDQMLVDFEKERLESVMKPVQETTTKTRRL